MTRRSRAAGYAARADGMARAEEGADERWFRGAVAFVTKFCRGNETMFCDDLWNAGLEAPREARALGPAIMECVRAGVIERSGRFRASVGSNMTPKPIWRSLVFTGKRTRWFMLRRKDGAYGANVYRSRKTGKWVVRWAKGEKGRGIASRWAKRAAAFEVARELPSGVRVISVQVRRIWTRDPRPGEVRPAKAKAKAKVSGKVKKPAASAATKGKR